MKRIYNQTTIALMITLVTACFAMDQTAHAASPAEQAIQAAEANNQFAFVMFYRGNDAATQAMHGTLQQTLAIRQDAILVPVQIGDAAEQALVKQFDATRMPMPAIATLAPNGAVCSVFPRRVTEQQLAAAIVSTGQTQILKALQNRKLVLLCAQPTAGTPVPAGVQQFQADQLYSNRTEVVTVLANDPAEAEFLTKIGVKPGQSTPVVAFMAPPGVMVGTFNANVSFDVLAEKLAASGKCCDDENCKHHKSAQAATPARR
ncbi:hypothetical protein NHH03_16520 [Stieleria sp. TO1_6]|uniref:hypothetical protein n=1 Tax=Stieleria tagensis TaxID=2956795 RepID=UPI00209BAFD7|nr:hypothetical protein [Stieleria tagensis]MCO8123356.1 hypothetical protein [Stieleria tagensis]